MRTAAWHRMTRDGVETWALDSGGSGGSVLLLHGLAGYAREWDDTVSWLSATQRVVAVEQRGHGRSTRRPADMARQSFVADAAAWIERLALAPAVVVGQSLGGHTAFLLAARRPDLVRGLVVVEAAPEPDPDAPEAVRAWLGAWPVPFADRAAALAHFGDTTWGRTWADGLAPAEDGLRPAFDVDVIVSALCELAECDHWHEWRGITCPTLVVRGERGVPAEFAARMVAALPSAAEATIADAGHDAHIEQPELWHGVLATFLAGVGRGRP